MEIIIIAAVSKNGVIGNLGKMPWKCDEELKFFKESTLNHPVMMGRKTYETLENPLPGRLNIIISRRENYLISGNCLNFISVEKAIEHCKKNRYKKCFIIGGGEIFAQTMSIADKLIISEMNFNCDGDTYFPKILEDNWNKMDSKAFNYFNVNYYTKVIQ